MELDREQIIIKTSMVGRFVNILLAVFKAVVGFSVHLIAIVLDAVNNPELFTEQFLY